METNVGAVLSSFIAFDVTDVMLQLPNQSHTFTEALVHVVHDSSVLIVQLTGVPDAIPTASV